jgi:3-phosphoshikimate 1-carboxyvinyltransferase
VTIQGVGLNPTRAALLDVLAAMGAAVKVTSLSQQNGELVGDLEVRSSALRGGVIEGATTAAVIDEIPVLAVLGAASERGLVVRNAAELRVKESDRIATTAQNLRRMGVEVREFEDGFEVTGRGAKPPVFRAAEIESFGDHRIAMAFAVAAVAADGPCTIHGAESAGISFPEFYATLESLRA